MKPRNSNDGVFGARFHLYIDRNAGLPTMNWMLTADRDKVHHPNSIISFCCHHVLPITKSDTLYGFTEHRRIDQENGQQHIFRAHPSYQSTSGQATGIWYDWAMFQVEDETIPCQIMCFLNIDYLKDDVMQTVRGYVIDQNGLYAVVRRFKNTPRPLSEMSIISTGEIEEGFYLLPCNSIYSEICVVPDYSTEEFDGNMHQICETPNRFFVVGNQSQWLSSFRQVFHYVTTIPRHELLRKGKDDYYKKLRENEHEGDPR